MDDFLMFIGKVVLSFLCVVIPFTFALSIVYGYIGLSIFLGVFTCIEFISLMCMWSEIIY